MRGGQQDRVSRPRRVERLLQIASSGQGYRGRVRRRRHRRDRERRDERAEQYPRQRLGVWCKRSAATRACRSRVLHGLTSTTRLRH
jgi:hypothetical protein